MEIERRRLTGVAAGMMVLALTGGCADPGAEVDPVSIGAVARSGTISALGLAAVTNGRSAATVVGTLLNEGEVFDRLVDAHAEAKVGVLAATLPKGAIGLAPGEPIQLATRKGIMLVSPDMREGFFIQLTLEFARSPDITMRIPVEPQSGPYSDIEVLQPADGDVAPDAAGTATPSRR